MHLGVIDIGRVISTAIQFIDGFTRPSREVIRNMQRMGNEAIKTGKQIQNAGKTITNAGNTLTKTITLPVAGIATAAVRTAADFESAMSEVGAISSASAKNMKILTEKAKEMGATTAFSASESAEAMKYMAMAGWKTVDMTKGIAGIMDLAAASGESLAATSDIVTDGLTAFGMTAKESSRFADVMAATSSNANTNVALMGETFKYCASTAGAMKYSVKDISIAIGIMGNAGIKGSMAGTTLKNVIANMAKPTDSQAAVMKKLGINLTDSSGNMKSFAEVMDNLRSSFSGLSKTEKAAATTTLAGKQSMAGLLTIVNASDKDFNKLTKAIKGSSGSAEKMAEKMRDNLNGQIILLKSAIEGILITIGDKLLPYIKKAVTWFQTVAAYINKLSDAQINNIIKWAGIAAAIGPAIMIFGKIVTALGTTHRMFGAITKTVANFGGIIGTITSPAGIVIAVLAAIAVAAVLIVKNWDKIKPVIMNVKEWFVSAFGGTIKQAIVDFKDIFTKTIKIVAAIIPTIGQFIKNAIQEAMPAVKILINAFKIMFPAAVETIKTVIQAAKPIAQSVIDTLSKVLPKVIEIIKSVIKSMVPIIKTIVETVVKTVPTITVVFTTVLQKLNPTIKTIGNIIKDVVPIIGKILSAAFEFTGKSIKKLMPIINKIIGLIGNGITFAVKTVSPVVIKLVDTFSIVFPKIVGFVKAAMTRLKPVFHIIGNIIKTVMNLIQDNVVHSFEIVVNAISGAAKGIKRTIGGITKTFSGILDFITGVFTGDWGKAWNGVKDIFGGTFDALVGMCKTPLNAVIGIINGAISGLNKINVSIPDWVPGLGGKSFGINIPTIPQLYRGTDNWKGGMAVIHDRGGEIVDLPRGSRVYPHDKSIEMARREGVQSGRSVQITIKKLADKIEVRREEDIDRIAEALVQKLRKVAFNTGIA